MMTLVEKQRHIALRHVGQRHGPITRLISPEDLGHLIRPFVFLDYVATPGSTGPNFGFHPHSGIATLTFPLTFDIEHQASTGQIDTIKRGGVEWVVAGKGIWHQARAINGDDIRGFQLWFALPPSLELSQPTARFIEPSEVPHVGPAKVLFGSYGGVASLISAPIDATYLWVQLRDGETWIYEPPKAHQVAWLFVETGTLGVNGQTLERELAVFEEGQGCLAFRANGDCAFLLGSAAKAENDLVLGPYSVHTSEEALEVGGRRIAEIGEQLRRDGRLQR